MTTLDRSTLTDAFLDALRQANRAGYLGGGGGAAGAMGGGGGTGSSSGGSDFLKKEGEGLKQSFIGAAGAAVDVGEKLFEGGARVSDATGAMAKGLQAAGMGSSYLGKAFSTSADLLNKLGTNIDQNVDTWRRLSDTGASFNNDIFEMKTQASNARMSLAEMSDLVRKNSENLAGLGATVGQSTKEFSKVSDKFFSEGLGTNLTRMGYNTKELNDVLAVSVSSMRLKDLQEKGGAERAAKSAAALATEMDEVAKITGKSKQEMLDDLRRKQADGQRQAAIDLAISRGGAGAAEAFNQITTTAAMGGKNFQKLAEDVAAMGRPSEGMEGAYAALGSEAQKLLQEAGAAARSGNQELAQQRVKEAAEARAKFQQTEEYRTLAAQGLKEFGDQYGEGKPLRKAMEAAGGSMKDLEKSVKDAQAGIDPDTGKKSPGAAITEFAVDVESRGRDLTKALNDNITQPLVTRIGPQLKKFSDEMNLGDPKKFKEGGVGKVVDAMATPQTQSAAKSALNDQIREQFKDGIKKDDPTAKEIAKLNSLISSGSTAGPVTQALRDMAKDKKTDVDTIIKDAMANKGAGVADLNKQLSASLTEKEKTQFDREQSGARPQWMSQAQKPLAENLGNAAGSALSGLGDLFIGKPGKVEVTNFPTRHEGTLGKTGQMFEPTDFFGIMKKGETMLTPEQLTNLVKGAKGSGLGESMAALQQSMKQSTTGADKAPSIDINSLSSQFNKTISSTKTSVSSGETTVREVQNEDAKAAKDELDSLWKKFGEDWQQRKQVLIEGMSVEDRKFSKVQAAMKADEASQKIKEEYEKKKSEIERRIAEGTKTEIDVKRDSLEQAQQITKEQLLQLTAYGIDVKKINNSISTDQKSSTEKARSIIETPEVEVPTINAEAIEKQIDEVGSTFSIGGIFKKLKDKVTGFFTPKKDQIETVSNAVQDEFGDLAGAIKSASERMYPDTEFGDLEGAMAKVAQDVDTEFGDLTGAMKRAAEEMYPDDEFGDLEGAMAKVAQDVHDEFGDLAGAMKASAERMYPDTEFGDLEGAMAKVAQDVDTEFGDLESAMAKVAQDVDTEFGDLAGAMKRAAEDMYPDTEFGDLESAMAKVAQDVDTEFGDLTGAMKRAAEEMYPDTEFGDLEGAIAKQKGKAINPETGEEYTPVSSLPETPAPADFDEFAGLDEATAKNKADDEATKKVKMPSLSSISFGPSGMPMFKQAEAARQSLGQKTASPGKKINPETGEEYTPVSSTTATKKEESKPTAAADATKSTLDDVVKSLNQLNSLMSRFVEDAKDIGNKQIRAVKSSSADLYSR